MSDPYILSNPALAPAIDELVTSSLAGNEVLEQAIQDRIAELGQTYETLTITADAILVSSTRAVLIDAAAGDITATLPALLDGDVFDIKRLDATANAVTIATPGAETIDGAVTLLIPSQYLSFTLLCDGTSWYLI